MDVSKRLNDLTNIAIVGLIAFVGLQYARMPGRASAAYYKPGDVVQGIPADTLRDSSRTLLIQVSSACQACDMAMPFYRQLVGQIRSAQLPLRIVALTDEEPRDCQAYLSEHSIQVDKVVSSNGADARLKMTPALLLVDSAARVMGAWVGGISGMERRREVARTLGLPQ
jgi:hypothetical protein